MSLHLSLRSSACFDHCLAAGGVAMNAVVKYPGAKWNIAEWIISFFPQHHSYLEPYFGSGAVLFCKRRSNIETVNDLNGDVINFFDWVKHDPERLAREIYLLPYARDVYDAAFDRLHTETDPFQRAVDFYTRMMMGHGFRTTGEKVGWKNDIQGREKAYAAIGWQNAPLILMEAAERLRGVQIENKPAVELIRRFHFRNVLIYADPPYLISTRHGKQYAEEMTDDDHAELLDALLHHPGPVLISGYDHELYKQKLSGWYKTSRHTIDQKSRVREEWLWMNFDPIQQTSLFDEIGSA